MRATFQPTNYSFDLKDEYFVEVMNIDGACRFVAVFAEFHDAKSFAETKLNGSPLVRMVSVFTRTQQHLSLHKPFAAAA